MKRVISFLIAEAFLVSVFVPAWASPTEFLRPKATIPPGLADDLGTAQDGGLRASDGGEKAVPFAITYTGHTWVEPRVKFINISNDELRSAIGDAFYNTPFLEDTLKALLKDPSFNRRDISEVKITYGDVENLISRFYLVEVTHSKGTSEFVLDVDRDEYDPSGNKLPRTFIILENLRQAYEADPRYTIQPYARAVGKVNAKTSKGIREVQVAMTTKECLKGWDNAYLIDPMGKGRQEWRIRPLHKAWQINEEIDLFLQKIIQIVTFYYVKLNQRAIDFIIMHGDFMLSHPELAHIYEVDAEDYIAQFMDSTYTELKGASRDVKIVSMWDLLPMTIPEFVQHLLTYEDLINPNAPRREGKLTKERIFLDPEIVWRGIEDALVEIYGEKKGQEELSRWKEACADLTVPAAAKDGGDQSAAWPEFSFKGKTSRKGMEHWEGWMQAGGMKFKVFFGSSDETALFQIKHPRTGELIAETEWNRGERPWLQSMVVHDEKYLGLHAKVRLADILMAVRVADIAQHGSKLEKMTSSPVLRPTNDSYPASLGIFRLYEKLGMRPAVKILSKWAGRIKRKHAKLSLETTLRQHYWGGEDVPHLRITYNGPDLLDTSFEESEIELFFVEEDGRVIEDGGIYGRLSKDPGQLEAILRRLAEGKRTASFEGRTYRVWAGGVSHEVVPEELPRLRQIIASFPHLPWAPEAAPDREARDGGVRHFEQPSRRALIPLQSL
ncbi:MAG: hypothetical protein ABH845_03975 [Candidatus Omnitrophota bacterium]